MKVILDDIKYRGFYIDEVTLDIPELGDDYDESKDGIINELIGQKLDELILKEASIRGQKEEDL